MLSASIESFLVAEDYKGLTRPFKVISFLFDKLVDGLLRFKDFLYLPIRQSSATFLERFYQLIVLVRKENTSYLRLHVLAKNVWQLVDLVLH